MNELDKKETILETETIETATENLNGATKVVVSKIKKQTANPGRKRLFVILSILAVTATVVSVYFLLWRGERSGQVVPAPRTISFEPGASGNENLPATSEEQNITLAPEQVQRSGIKIEPVGEILSTEAASLAATGVVQANAYNETPVVSLIGGVVRRVAAELGQNVRRGQTLVVVSSDELASAQSRYLALQTEAQTALQNYQRADRLLQIGPVGPTSRGEIDQAQAKLKTDEAELDEMRGRYNRTVKLSEIGAASREELEQDAAKLRIAEAEVEQSRKQFQRVPSEVAARMNPVIRGEFEQASVKLRTAESELAAAKQRLTLLGLSTERVNALVSPSQISSEISISSPITGTVTARSANQGEVIEANKELIKVTNLSTVWVIAQVYERDLGRVRVGSGAAVTTDAYPGRLFRGRVTYIDPNINSETRTAQVRVELNNPGRIFKIGMYVNVAFESPGTGKTTAPVIPAAAVQNINNRQTVFVATNSPNMFVLKPVRLGAEISGRYIVLEGLNVGDKAVTNGSFLLRAEWLKQHPAGQ